MAIEFRLLKDAGNTEYRQVRIASQAYAIGDAVMQDRVSDAVDVVPAISSTITGNIYGVAMSTQVSTDTTLLICIVTPAQQWAADATNTTNTNHNQQRMALTDKGTVNNTGTDVTGTTGVFEQIGTLTTTRIVGRFIPKAQQ
jgi:hypothetical protein